MQNNPRDRGLEGQLDRWAADQSSAEVSRKAEEQIHQALAGALTPVKPIPSPLWLAATFLLLFVFAGIALIAVQSKTGFRLMTVGQMAVITAIGLGGAVLFSLSLAWQMIPGARRFFSLSLALVLSGAAMIGGFMLLFPWSLPRTFAAEGWRCSLMEVMIAVPAAILFWLLAKRGFTFRGAGLGATLSGLAVLLALTVIQFQCMFQQAPHLLVWHGGVGALLIGLGALVARPRRQRT